MVAVGSTATTDAPVRAATTVVEPIPEPRSTTRSPARGSIDVTTSRPTSDLHMCGSKDR